MINKLITNIPIYYILLQYAKSQYNPSLYSGMQGYQYPYQNIAYPPYPNQRIYKDYENKWPMQDNRNYEDYNDYTEEIPCACDKCDELKPSCKDVCPNCLSTPPPVIAPSYVFLPFPYPYPMSPNTTLAPVQTVETTTPSTVKTVITTDFEPSTTEKVKQDVTVEPLTSKAVTLSNSLPDENNDVLREKSPFNVKDKGQYMLTSLRRTKPHWLPKYGIVPISDKFAEKLMLQLRSMKVLHPQKDNIRNIDDIDPN